MATRASLTVVSGGIATSAWANGIRDHIVPYSGAADGTTEGMLSVNTADDTLRIGNGSAAVAVANYGSWGTFTCDVRQVGIASTTETECEWWRSGRDISGGGVITLGSITAAAGNAIEIDFFGLPTPSGLFQHIIGTFLYHDVGAGWYGGSLLLSSSGVGQLRSHSTGGLVGVSPSFAAVINDQIFLNFRYRANSTT